MALYFVMMEQIILLWWGAREYVVGNNPALVWEQIFYYAFSISVHVLSVLLQEPNCEKKQYISCLKQGLNNEFNEDPRLSLRVIPGTKKGLKNQS